MRNCPNCGAPISPYEAKCKYCGTMYLDLANWLEDGKPCYINYKFNNMCMQARVIPKLEHIEMSNDTIDTSNYLGEYHRYLVSNRCDICVTFTCVNNVDDNNELFRIKEG